MADYWKQLVDLRYYLATNWKTVGPKLYDKLNVYVGDMDRYYLNDAVHLLDDFLSKTTNPKWTGKIVYQPRAPHCWGPPPPALLQKMEAHMLRAAPAGADTTGWRY